MTAIYSTNNVPQLYSATTAALSATSMQTRWPGSLR